MLAQMYIHPIDPVRSAIIHMDSHRSWGHVLPSKGANEGQCSWSQSRVWDSAGSCPVAQLWYRWKKDFCRSRHPIGFHTLNTFPFSGIPFWFLSSKISFVHSQTPSYWVENYLVTRTDWTTRIPCASGNLFCCCTVCYLTPIFPPEWCLLQSFVGPNAHFPSPAT